MGIRDEKEKQKMRRETLGKHFFNLSLATFTAMVLSNFAPLFGASISSKIENIGLIVFGAFATFIFAFIGNQILKH